MLKDCCDLQTLTAYAQSQLETTETTRVEQHLESCQRCCVVLSQIVDSNNTRSETLAVEVFGESIPSSASSQGHPAYRFWADQKTSVEEPTVIPTHIGRYRIKRLIGSGGFGRVYLAVDEELDRSVAIKVPHAKTAATPKQLALIQAEAKTVARLDHVNIVPIYDVGSTPEFPVYLVSKLVDGQNLAAHLATGCTAQQAVVWTIQIADALAHAHGQGILHRDVKPHNVLIDASGHARLTDFGLAWRLSDDQLEFPNAGTPAYMSPEQRQSNATIDQRSDVYSLGIVLSELCMSMDGSAGPQLVQALEAICRRATQTRAADRYGSVQELAYELRELAHRQSWYSATQELLASASVTLPATSKPHRTLASIGLVAVLLIAAWAGWSNWQSAQAVQRELADVQAYLVAPTSELSSRMAALTHVGSAADKQLRMAADSSDDGVRLRARLALMDKQPEWVAFVADAMLSADVELSAVLAQKLLPYRSQLQEKFWQVLRDDFTSPHRRLNASSYIVQAFPDDPEWHVPATVSALTDAFLHDNLGDLSAHARAHRDALATPYIVSQLRSMVWESVDRSDPKLARAFEVWEQLVFGNASTSVDLLIETPIEIADRIIQQLQGNELARSQLRAVLDLRIDQQPEGVDLTLLYRAKFMAAYALQQLGAPDDFWQLWQDNTTPDMANAAAIAASESAKTLGLIADRLLNDELLKPLDKVPPRLQDRLFSPSISLRRLLLHALLRTVRWQGLDNEKMNNIFSQVRRLVNEDADPGMQAMAGWAVKGVTHPSQWEKEPWFAEPTPAADAHQKAWSRNSLGIQMIHLYGADDIDHGFMLSQKEVEVRYFAEFLNDSGYPWPGQTQFENYKSSNWRMKPQNFVSWYDCAAFCNWLSRREGLEECYSPNPSGQYASGMAIAPNAHRKNGYRLPLSLEWQIACRAGASTRFASGDVERYQAAYSGTSATTRELFPTGHVLPNRLGFFDLQGNVCEWMHDEPIESEAVTTIVDSRQRISRGGHFLSRLIDTEWHKSESHAPSDREQTLGFRIARTLQD